MHRVDLLDATCERLERVVDFLLHPATATRTPDQLVSEGVQLIQGIGEGIAWAYGQHQRPFLGEQFAQPFVDRRIRDRLKALLAGWRAPRRDLQTRIAVQILQTIHILLQATPSDSTLFCNLTAGWYLNEVVAAPLEFAGNDDLLPLWMTVVKDIATMVTDENIMLFFNPGSPNPFPIFSEAIKYYHHPVSQVRTHVQATTLEIYLKLRSQDPGLQPVFDLVLLDSCVLFSHVCCLLRDFWRMADEAFAAGSRREARSAVSIQNDMVMYLNDVFLVEIPALSAVLQEKLLRFCLLPVLLRSALGCHADPQEKVVPSPELAWYLVCDLLETIRSPALLNILTGLLLRPTVPEEALVVLQSPPPKTPTQYLSNVAHWGGSGLPGPFDLGRQIADQALYAMPQPAMALTYLMDSKHQARPWVQNRTLDFLEARLFSIVKTGEALRAAPSLLFALGQLLRVLAEAGEGLDGSVADRLGRILSELLARHAQLQWVVLIGVLRTLKALAAAVDVPAGRARLLLGPCLREQVLAPLAAEVLQAVSQPSDESGAQENWLREFQEQWAASATDLQGAGPCRKELADPGQEVPDPPGTPEGRARSCRVLLAAVRLVVAMTPATIGTEGGRELLEMPGIDQDETEETVRFQPGVSVEIGKVSRVKCQLQIEQGPVDEEAVYLLPAQSTLLLGRPDAEQPFWAVPVISEPLRSVRMDLDSENLRPNGNVVDDPQKVLRLEVTNPRSSLLLPRSSFPLGDRMVVSLAGAPLGRIDQDPFTGSMPVLPRVPHDMSKVSQLSSASMKGPGVMEAVKTSITLVFADERRRKVACKLIAQASHHTSHKLADGVLGFLAEVQRGVLPL